MNPQLINFSLTPKTEKATILELCQGNNAKGVCLIYNAVEIEKLPFLAKILAAVQLDIKDDVITISSTIKQSFSLSDLSDELSLKKVIIFGFSPQHIGLQVQFQKYQLYTIGSIQYLFADKLELIEQTKAKKGLLWGALQQMFTK